MQKRDDENSLVDSTGTPATSSGVSEDNASITSLREALRDPRPLVRREAVAELGKCGSPEAAAALCSALLSADATLRQDAARLLGQMGGPTAVGSLCRALDDPERAVREQVVEALVRLGPPAVLPLIQRLADHSRRARTLAAQTLCRIGDRRAVGPLCTALQHGALAQPHQVIEWLGTQRDRAAVPVLCGLLREGGVEAEAAARALGEIGGPEAVDALARALASEVHLLRCRAAAALGDIGGPQALEVLRSRLMKTCAAPVAEIDSEEQGFLETAIARCGSGAAELIRPLVNGQQYELELRLAAVRILGALGDAAALRPLCALLEDSRPVVRRNAVEALGRIGRAEASDRIAPLLEDREPTVRDQAAHTLTLIGWQPATLRQQLLLYLARSEYKAAAALGEEALKLLLEFLRSRSPALRRAAACALAELGRREALPPLRERCRPLFGETHPEVREAIGNAIRRIETSTRDTESRPRPASAPPAGDGRPRTGESAHGSERRPRSADG